MNGINYLSIKDMPVEIRPITLQHYHRWLNEKRKKDKKELRRLANINYYYRGKLHGSNIRKP